MPRLSSFALPSRLSPLSFLDFSSLSLSLPEGFSSDLLGSRKFPLLPNLPFRRLNPLSLAPPGWLCPLINHTVPSSKNLEDGQKRGKKTLQVISKIAMHSSSLLSAVLAAGAAANGIQERAA